MNHKYDIDWLAGWVICQRLGIIHGSKIVGKQSLKLVPILGWCWIFTESIFLRRVWDSDRETLVNDLRKVLDHYPKNFFFNVTSVSLSLSSLICSSSLVPSLLRRNTVHREKTPSQYEDRPGERPARVETSHPASNQRFHPSLARRRRSK